jgi:predicted RNase H-like nuclease (RuvC/YqgF family)
MATYLNQDHNALLDMDNKTEEVIDAYRNLIKVSTMANSTDADPEKLTQNIEELLDKNQKLSDEIDKLKNEMDVTVQEYSSAFRNKQDKGSAADESVEPDFQTSSLDNDEDQDLEALAAQLANEEEDLEENSSIPLDGLDEDDDILKSAGNIGPT